MAAGQPGAVLVLEDGMTFHGTGFGADGETFGEMVFNTGMTGYQETLTDPSYARQIVAMTAPHIGNTGVNDEDPESPGVYAEGLIVRDVPRRLSNYRSQSDLTSYLRSYKIPGIAYIDTRKLTRILREKGAQNGCLIAGTGDEKLALEKARAFPGLAGMDLAKVVSVREPYEWTEGQWEQGKGYRKLHDHKTHVVAYDYGIKRNILRLLAERGSRVTVVPAAFPAKEVLKMRPDGVFLSNGPGDPEPCDYAIEAIGELLDATKLPVFGICLGHQLMGLASGAKTLKMKFGHHGANHPVLDKDTGQVLITSQNHGFAVDASTLPRNVRITHVSLFDGSLQGIEFTDKPAFGFQGHPEGSPGPHDLAFLFDRFTRMMERHAVKAVSA